MDVELATRVASPWYNEPPADHQSEAVLATARVWPRRRVLARPAAVRGQVVLRGVGAEQLVGALVQNNMGLTLRRVTGSAVKPAARHTQEELYGINLGVLALLMEEELEAKDILQVCTGSTRSVNSESLA